MKRRNTVAITAVLVALLALAAAVYFLRPGPSQLPSTAQAPEAGDSPAPATASPPASQTTPPATEEKAETPPEDKAEDTPAPAEEKADTAPPAEEKAADAPPATEDKMADAPAPAEEKAADAPAPAEDKAADESASAEEKKADAATPQPTAAEQPSFDVVRIEPTGEGVIAGRAAPGWKVIVESRGVKVAEVAADDQGEWTVVFDRPLPPGAHDLSLKATSPDGSQQSSSEQSVSADVATPPTKKAALPEAEIARMSDATPPAVKQAPATVTPAPKPALPEPGRAAPGSAPPLPQTASVDEETPTPPASLPPQTKPGSYTILPGDTLWDIAQRYLGAGWRYKTIFRDNRKIIRNPNLIYPEQKMTIAEPPSEPN